ncbi:CHAT domain-containing protein [Ideonella sp. YS5]|uniref:CHAT domain-containing protein n=1 Tax=Ideonella sp. YS5 TaxID=3453714 RepID=UPI003EEBD6AA
MFEIKKGARTDASTGEPAWRLAPSVAQRAMPGTVFAVDGNGKSSVVGRLAMKVANSGGVNAVPVHASVGACHRMLGLDRPAGGADSPCLFTLELPDSEAETIDEEDLEARLSELLEKVQPIYRADHRYFVVRGSISAPSIVIRRGPSTSRGRGPAEAGVDVSQVQALSFGRMTPVAVLLDEIRTVKSNLGSGPPQLGLAQLDEPLGWAEDMTVPWVTSIVEPVETARTRTFAVARAVELRTSIGIAGDPGELASIGISPEMLANAVIRFKVTIEGAQVRPKGGADALASSIVSPELRFQADTPAAFVFLMQADAPGRVALHVTLYLNGRPTLRQDMALTAELAAPAATAMATASATFGAAAPAATPADAPAVATAIDGRNLITLPAPRIALEFGSYDQEYPIELTVDGRRALAPAKPAINRADLAHKTIEWRRRLVALSDQYGRAEGGELSTAVPDALRAFARIGVEIHRALFGRPTTRGIEDLRRVADSIAQVHGDAGQRPLMTISAERLPLPWGLVYDRPLPDDGPVDTAGFWGQRFLIERIAPAVLGKVPGRSLCSTDEPGAQLVACVNGHLDDQQRVVAAARQVEFFEQLAQGALASRPLVTTRDDFQRWLVADRGESRLVYFFCHANSAHTMDERYFQSREASDAGTWLDLDADERLRIDINWLADKRDAPLAGQPLVFLNACSTAEGDREFQSPFLTQFIRGYDARGLIGSDWKVPTVFADEFSRRFLRRFLLAPGASVGQALAATSDEFMAAGNPFALIYAIYGRSDIVVTEETTP